MALLLEDVENFFFGCFFVNADEESHVIDVRSAPRRFDSHRRDNQVDAREVAFDFDNAHLLNVRINAVCFAQVATAPPHATIIFFFAILITSNQFIKSV